MWFLKNILNHLKTLASQRSERYAGSSTTILAFVVLKRIRFQLVESIITVSEGQKPVKIAIESTGFSDALCFEQPLNSYTGSWNLSPVQCAQLTSQNTPAHQSKHPSSRVNKPQKDGEWPLCFEQRPWEGCVCGMLGSPSKRSMMINTRVDEALWNVVNEWMLLVAFLCLACSS